MKSTESADLHLLMINKSSDQKTHQWVYQLLRNNLLCGRVEPGKPLTIRGLAEILHVSPMPVREALHRLACEGAVEVKNLLPQPLREPDGAGRRPRDSGLLELG